MGRVLASLLLLTGCGPDEGGPGEVTTAVDVSIDADACSAAGAERLRVRVLDRDGAEVGAFDVDVAGADAEHTFPTGVQVVPRGGDASRGWQVEATLIAAGDVPIAYQRARGAYVEGNVGSAALLFDDACVGIECPAGETCVEAVCEPADAESSRPRHEPRMACPAIAFVDGAGGSDTMGCGAWDSPCATLQRAADDHLAGGEGGVIHVRGGSTYTSSAFEVLKLDSGHQGRADAPVVIRAWPGTGTPELVGGADTDALIDGDVAYLVIDGLSLHGAQRFGLSFNGVSSHDIVVRRCEIYGNGAGAGEFDTHSGIVLNNGAGDLLVEDSTLRDMVVPAMMQHGDGIYFNAGMPTSRGLTVRRCDVRDNGGYGIYTQNAGNVRIEGSRIAGSGRIGIDMDANGPIALEGVRICGSGTAGIQIADAEDVTLSHLSVVGSGTFGVNVFGTGRVVHRGNLVVDSEGTGVQMGMSLEVEDSHNLYFGNMTPLAGFTPAEPATDVMEDPLLTGVETCDLGLGAGSPALGAGPDGTNIGAR